MSGIEVVPESEYADHHDASVSLGLDSTKKNPLLHGWWASSMLYSQRGLLIGMFVAFAFLGFPLRLALQGGNEPDHIGTPLNVPKRRLASTSTTINPKQLADVAGLLQSLEIDGSSGSTLTYFELITGQPHGLECATSLGNHFLTKTYKNKVDYCNMHGCNVRYTIESWGLGTRGSPPSVLLRLMSSNPNVPWFMWMDSEAMFSNMSYAFPLQTYTTWGKHFIVPGKANGGLGDWSVVNPVVFLVRNSEWSRNFLTKWKAKIAKKKVASEQDMRVAELELEQEEGDVTNARYKRALVHAIKESNEDDIRKMFLEDGYYLHGRGDFIVERYDGLDILGNHEVQDVKWPFIVHFKGCNLCQIGQISDICLGSFQRAFHYADNQLLALVGLQHQQLYATLA